MSARLRLAAGAATVALLATAFAVVPAATATATTASTQSTNAAIKYEGDPKAEATLAASEDARITDVRTIANAEDWRGTATQPYQLSMGSGYTLVLVARKAPYTLQNIADLAPRYFSKGPDGSWLLSENIVVDNGATLDFSSDQRLVLHLVSKPSQFVSIVTIGGSLTLNGPKSSTATVTSWNPDTGKVDDDTSDGRAYIRVVGGRASLSEATFENLGFWSGLTGGVALTGTGTTDSSAVGSDAAPAPTLPSGTGTNTTSTGSGTGTASTTSAGSGAAGTTSIHGTTVESTDGSAMTTPTTLDDGYGYVSALIQSVTFRNDAFGLFVTSADGVSVRDSTAEDNKVDGFVFHRHVTNSEILRTAARGNRVDGFDLDRASSGVTMTRLDARDNGRNGITMNGSALASGPSATGLATGAYGNNTVTNSTSVDNGRYGIEVTGGSKIDVTGNTLTRNVVGLVVANGAKGVSATANDVEGSTQQGIAFRDAGTGNTISRNTVGGGDIGIYVRNSEVTVSRNQIDDVGVHAVTLVGDTGNSTVTKNSASGRGPSAIDVARTTGSTVDANVTKSWRSTKPLLTVIKNFLQPLTVMWLLLALVLIITAFTSIGRRHQTIHNPYANLAPLSTYTRGEFRREQLAAATRARNKGNTA